jgi:hypothetical protein
MGAGCPRCYRFRVVSQKVPDAAGQSQDGGAASPADEVERSLDVLDTLSGQLGRVDALRETLAALVVESRKLRRDNRRLAEALVAQKAGKSGVDALQAAQERVRLHQQQVADLIEENTDLNSRLLELEELNGSMMSMYVSSYQLHANLDLNEVVSTIEEIVVNFIGARAYAVLLNGPDDELVIATSKGVDGRLPDRNIEPRGVLAEVIGSKTAYVHTSDRAAREGILAAVPLCVGKDLVGAVIIYSLLSQKDRLLKNDLELLSLLGGHAASAIVSAQLYARADRKLKTLEGVLSLLGEDGD